MAIPFKRPNQAAPEPAQSGLATSSALGRIPRTVAPQQQAPAAPAAPRRAENRTASRAVAPAAAETKAQRFGYPFKNTLPFRAAAFLIMALSLVYLVQAVRLVLETPGFPPFDTFNIITAVSSLGFSFLMALLLADALPSFEARGEGLAISWLFRQRVLPWERVARLHTMELQNDRFIVFLEYTGRPVALAHRVNALLAGVSGNPGVFYTSTINGFEDLTRLILSARMRATPGARIEDLLDEESHMPLFSMLVSPVKTMNRLAGVVDDSEETLLLGAAPMHGLARGQAIKTQLLLASVPVLLFWADRLTRGLVPPFSDALPLFWTTVGLLIVGVGELFVVALAMQALGETFVGRGEFDLPFVVYPYLELIRLLGFAVTLALIAVKAPFLLALVFWLFGSTLVASLSAVFAQRLYGVTRGQALLGGGASVVMQLLIVILFLMMRG